MIQFGTNPIAWANDDDQTIGADIPTARILDEAGRQIGFDGIENGHRWPDDPEALRALLAGYGLTFVSGWYSTNLLVQSVEDEIEAVPAPSGQAEAQRLQGLHRLRNLERHPWRRASAGERPARA